MKFGITPEQMSGVTLGEWNKMMRYLEREDREARRANRG